MVASPVGVCFVRWWCELPMAPLMVVDVFGWPWVELGVLVAELVGSWTAWVDVGLVEAVGGVRSPLADDGDSVDLAEALMLDVVVFVVHVGLGMINVVCLSINTL